MTKWIVTRAQWTAGAKVISIEADSYKPDVGWLIWRDANGNSVYEILARDVIEVRREGAVVTVVSADGVR